jgi:hypothetical protein
MDALFAPSGAQIIDTLSVTMETTHGSMKIASARPGVSGAFDDDRKEEGR